ncbi:MAG: tRNA (guanosine(37)-N1)-methyltransferase TrmD [Eubacterium sp.]|nr:tRNA (guanosine(37)-N1)-methyltransferase TrmD [Eubacterium sp.]
MHFYIMTLFPEMFPGIMETSILGRAKAQGLLDWEAVNIRDYTLDKHMKVDDYPYGGGAGMVMQAEPIYRCFEALTKKMKPEPKKKRVIYVTPQGHVFNQKMAEEFAREEELVFLCGHYEGVDERVLEEIVTDYVSIGDYVLTGGELPAMVMIDTISRLVPGVLHNQDSAETESFSDGLLEYPQYTRPETYHEKKVPEVLLSGHHKNIEAWRFEKAIERTKTFRPDLYEQYLKDKKESF